LPPWTEPDADGKPQFYEWGDEGPPRHDGEVRRHVYRRDGAPVRIKVKNESAKGPAYVNWYRVVKPTGQIGWQARKPGGYQAVPYIGAIDPFDEGVQNDLIYWSEGEKDCETLGKVNLPAFTFGGCGDGLPEGASKYLTGRQIVILADNDKAGHDHAQKKAALARGADAQSTKIVDFPELREHTDVSDFIVNGGTAEELIRRATGAPEWQPSEPPAATLISDAWHDPDWSLLDDRRGALPDFPVDVFSEQWRNWLKLASHGAGVTADHVAVPLIGIASGLIGGARLIQASLRL